MHLKLAKPDDQIISAFSSLSARRDLAALLEVPYGVFHFYSKQKTDNYKRFTIKKRNGSERNILAPITPLKIIQKKLSYILQTSYSRYYKPSVYGFRKGKSIVDHASRHQKQKNVLRVDIKDFFPSITQRRTIGIFRKGVFKLPMDVAQAISEIACFEGSLPQGAPTSPVISNILCGELDKDLQELAKTHRCTYSRYCDDITFSNSSNNFPREIFENGNIGSDLREAIIGHDFVINDKKTALRKPFQRQLVTGLVVNKKPNVKRIYVKKIRAMLHSWDKFGLENASREHFSKRKNDLNNRVAIERNFSRVLEGRISYLKMVKGQNDLIYLKLFKEFCRLSKKPFPYETILEAELGGKKDIIRKYAEDIRDLIVLCNDYSTKDIFTPTNEMTKCLSRLNTVSENYEGLKGRVEDLYKILYEGSGYGKRLEDKKVALEVLSDIETIRHAMIHDLDHGKSSKGKKTKLIAKNVFKKYIGLSSADGLEQQQYFEVQKKLYTEVINLLEDVKSTLGVIIEPSQQTGYLAVFKHWWLNKIKSKKS